MEMDKDFFLLLLLYTFCSEYNDAVQRFDQTIDKQTSAPTTTFTKLENVNTF